MYLSEFWFLFPLLFSLSGWVSDGVCFSWAGLIFLAAPDQLFPNRRIYDWADDNLVNFKLILKSNPCYSTWTLLCWWALSNCGLEPSDEISSGVRPLRQPGKTAVLSLCQHIFCSALTLLDSWNTRASCWKPAKTNSKTWPQTFTNYILEKYSPAEPPSLFIYLLQTNLLPTSCAFQNTCKLFLSFRAVKLRYRRLPKIKT